MSASISRLLVGGQLVELLQDAGQAVVDVGADLLENGGVLVEGVRGSRPRRSGRT